MTAVRSERLAYRAVRDGLGGAVGDLENATVLSIASGLLPPSLSHWYKRFPGVSLRLLEFRHRRLLEEAVLGGAGDVAIGPQPASWAGPVVPLGLERFVLVLSPNDPAAARVKPYAQGPPRAAPQSRGTLSLPYLSEHS